MPHYNVLFLCTGNSARSILAEAILNGKGAPTFTAYSAGSHPSGTVRPEALRQIESAGFSTAGLRSKSWDEFAQPGRLISTSYLRFAITRRKEVCPIWPGQPITAHWGVPDPAAVRGTPQEIDRAYAQAFSTLDRRISLLLSLPDRLAQLPRHPAAPRLHRPPVIAVAWSGVRNAFAHIVRSPDLPTPLSRQIRLEPAAISLAISKMAAPLTRTTSRRR